MENNETGNKQTFNGNIVGGYNQLTEEENQSLIVSMASAMTKEEVAELDKTVDRIADEMEINELWKNGKYVEAQKLINETGNKQTSTEVDVETYIRNNLVCSARDSLVIRDYGIDGFIGDMFEWPSMHINDGNVPVRSKNNTDYEMAMNLIAQFPEIFDGEAEYIGEMKEDGNYYSFETKLRILAEVN